MQQCYETITQWFMCSPSQAPRESRELTPLAPTRTHRVTIRTRIA
jgi:hypothetical protein